MGHVLLLRRCRQLGLVLPLPLRASDLWCVEPPSVGTWRSRPALTTRPSRRLPPDLRDVDKMMFDFDLGKPFHPFEQLMGVLPAASQSHIPEAFRVRAPAVCCLSGCQHPTDLAALSSLLHFNSRRSS